MLRVAICRDAQSDNALLSTELEKAADELHIQLDVHIYQSVEEMNEDAEAGPHRLMFLGIRIGDRDGIEFASTLRENGNHADIVFSAPTPERAYEAYRVFPTGFYVGAITQKMLKDLLRHLCPNECDGFRLVLRSPDGSRVCADIDSIMYIDVYRTELDVHCRDEVLICSGSLSDAWEHLPSIRFYRAHRSIIVNLAYVQKLERYQFTMKNGEKVTVAKNRYAEAKAALLAFANSTAT